MRLSKCCCAFTGYTLYTLRSSRNCAVTWRDLGLRVARLVVQVPGKDRRILHVEATRVDVATRHQRAHVVHVQLLGGGGRPELIFRHARPPHVLQGHRDGLNPINE